MRDATSALGFLGVDCSWVGAGSVLTGAEHVACGLHERSSAGCAAHHQGSGGLLGPG